MLPAATCAAMSCVELASFDDKMRRATRSWNQLEAFTGMLASTSMRVSVVLTVASIIVVETLVFVSLAAPVIAPVRKLASQRMPTQPAPPAPPPVDCSTRRDDEPVEEERS